MPRTLNDSLRWVSAGTLLCERAIADSDLSGPCALPGWSRAMLLGHLGLNARGLLNLVSWARTGVETPMYVSMEQRSADIEASGQLSRDELVERFRTSAAELGSALAGLTAEQWERDVRTAQGRTVPATFIPWLRSREVMIHAVDLAGAIDWADLPTDFLEALVDDIAEHRSTAGAGPALALVAAESGARWDISGSGEPRTVQGPLPLLAAYLAGRQVDGLVADEGPVPVLPAWI